MHQVFTVPGSGALGHRRLQGDAQASQEKESTWLKDPTEFRSSQQPVAADSPPSYGNALEGVVIQNMMEAAAELNKDARGGTKFKVSLMLTFAMH